MDTKVWGDSNRIGHESRNFLTFGRSLLSNSYVKGNNPSLTLRAAMKKTTLFLR